MYLQSIINDPSYFSNIPVIDADFDRFELKSDFEMTLREAEVANFYHDALDPEE